MEGEAGRKLGDANLAYATHDFPTAIELLREVIRLAPNNPDPYQTLGMIYEELAGGDGGRAPRHPRSHTSRRASFTRHRHGFQHIVSSHHIRCLTVQITSVPQLGTS